MNISSDGVTVRFKTKPEDLFMAEKSGAKPNTVRIIDHYEYKQLKKKLPEKIIIQHGQEIFLRTVTHVYFSETILGKYIAVFSWTNEKHHYAMHSETNHRPGDHNMSLDPTELCRRIDTSQRAILIPGALIQQLQDADLLSSLPAFISKMLEEHRIKRAEERGPIDPQSNLRLPVPLILDLIGFSGDDTVPAFISKLLEQYRTKLLEQYRTKRAEERGPLHD